MNVRRLLLVLLLASRVASADDAACVADHGTAQELRKQSKLRAARAKLERCAGQTCPRLVQGDCVKWLEEVEREIPSIVVSATDADGQELSDLRVLIDGEEVAKSIDGKPIELDPGSYTLRLENADGTDAEQRIVAKTGVKNAVVQLSFGEETGPRASVDGAKPAPSRTLVWVFGGISALAFGSFAYFAITGQSDYDRLKDECSPRCTKTESDDVKRKFLFADVSLAVGVAAAGAATYFWLSPPRASESGARRPIGVSVRAQPRGAFVGVALGL